MGEMVSFPMLQKGMHRGGKIDRGKGDAGLGNKGIGLHVPDRMGKWVIGNGEGN
jgi:hypothetical protein